MRAFIVTMYITIQKLFKQYIVKRKNGQCQILIPLVELDELCKKIETLFRDANKQIKLPRE